MIWFEFRNTNNQFLIKGFRKTVLTEEVFKIDQILNTNPVTYQIIDLVGDSVEGSLYEEWIQKTDQSIFRIEKVIRKDVTKKQALVKWRGYPQEFNSWVPLSEVHSLKPKQY